MTLAHHKEPAPTVFHTGPLDAKGDLGRLKEVLENFQKNPNDPAIRQDAINFNDAVIEKLSKKDTK